MPNWKHLQSSIPVPECLPQTGDAAQAIRLIVADGVEAFLPLAGMLDIGKEIQRLSKQTAKLKSESEGLTKRLSSSSVCIPLCTVFLATLTAY